MLSSDEESSKNRGINPPISEIATALKTEPVMTETVDVIELRSFKKKRLCMTASPPKSQKEIRHLRHLRRNIRKEYKGAKSCEIKLQS